MTRPTPEIAYEYVLSNRKTGRMCLETVKLGFGVSLSRLKPKPYRGIEDDNRFMLIPEMTRPLTQSRLPEVAHHKLLSACFQPLIDELGIPDPSDI